MAKRVIKGFSLVELLVTVAVLGFGIVAIYESFFVSMDIFGYYANYLNVHDWMNEKIASAREELTAAQNLQEGQTSGQIIRNQKIFQWSMTVRAVDVPEALYEVRVSLSWQEGGKTMTNARVSYLIPPQLKKYNAQTPA